MVDIAKILAVFVLMMVLLNRKVNLGLVMLTAAAIFGSLFQMNPPEIVGAALVAMVDESTLRLLVILVLISFLENIMRKNMILQRMVSGMKALIPDHRLVMALLPAFIGLLPSPGGAMFSAPLVGEASREFKLTAERKSFINYWYRHIWEYVIPLFPSVVLASTILSVDLRDFMIRQIPFTLVAVLAGIPIGFWGMKNHSVRSGASRSWRDLADALIGIGPITGVIVVVLLFNVDLILALAVAVVGLLIVHRYNLARILALRESISFNIALLVVGVNIFKEVLEQSGAVNAIPAFVAAHDIPVAVMVFALPFLVGWLTGVAAAFVAIAFPVFLGLFSSGAVDLNMTAFAFASGIAGVMLSPAHLCLALTIQHFKADLGRVQLMLLASEGAIVVTAAILYLPR